MPNWFPAELLDVWLSEWGWEVVWMLLAGWVAGLLSLTLTGLRLRK